MYWIMRIAAILLATCDDRLIRQGQRLRENSALGLNVINPVDLAQEV